MYYQSIQTILEEEFDNNNFTKEEKYRALDILNKLSDNFDKLSNSKPIYLIASIAFFVFLESGKTRNFKQLGLDFGIEAKTIALKVKEITQILDLNNPEEIIKKGLFAVPEEHTVISDISLSPTLKEARGMSEEREEENRPITHFKEIVKSEFKGSVNPRKNIPEDILKIRRNINAKAELKDQELINLFKQFKSFVTLLFKDKDYIEIKQFLKLLELNLYMSGYEIKNLDIEKKFGDLFIYLGLEPKKGRESEKFVHLKDRFGQSEPYTLIKLGE